MKLQSIERSSLMDEKKKLCEEIRNNIIKFENMTQQRLSEINIDIKTVKEHYELTFSISMEDHKFKL